MVTKRLLPLWLFLIFAATLCAQTGFKPSWAKTTVPLADALMGAWTITSIGGEQVPAGSPPITIRFISGEYFISQGSNEVESGQYILEEGPSGTKIDFMIRTGENARTSQHGIIELKGQELRWCMGVAGNPIRPSYFGNAPADGKDSPQTVITAVLAHTGATAAIPSSTLSDAIQGTWIVCEANGVRYPDGENESVYQFEGNKWTLYESGSARANGSYILDENSKPAKLTLILPNKTKANVSDAIYGIVEVNGNMLRLNMSRWFDTPLQGTEFKLYHDNDGKQTNYTYAMFRKGTNPPPQAIVTPDLAPGRAGSPNLAALLQGTWKVTSIGGRSRSASDRPMTFVFASQEFRMEDDGMAMLAGQWTVGADHNPMTIDISLIGADRQPTGDQIQGLVEVNGDTLRLAMGDPNTPRPRSFSSSKDTDGIDSSLMIAEKSSPDARQYAGFAQQQKVERANPVPNLIDAIQGRWLAKESGGRPIQDGPFVTTYEGETWSVKSPTGSAKGHFRINDSVKPAQIDVLTDWASWTNDPVGVAHGILELNGATLRTCFGNPGEDFRPTAFENARPRGSIPGHDSTLGIFIRDGSASLGPTSASSLQGTWKVTSIGGRTRDKSARPMTFVFTGQEFRMEDDGMAMLAGQWKVGADRNPMTIDISLIGADRQPTGDQIQGLIEVNGNTLRLAMGDPNTPRPRSFNSSKDTDGIDSSLMIAEKQ